jgi:glycerophosphoryl diester phosphodiesterase
MTLQPLKEAFREQRPLIFGHRGASAYAPMNTLPAYELALAQGANGIELDVRLTRDDELIILHDRIVEHTTDGTDSVYSKTLAEAKELDAGSWFDPRFAGTRLPTLDEVFEALGGRLYINVEIKSEDFSKTVIEQKIADSIRRFGLQASVIISSFNPVTLRRFRKIAPEVMIGYLHDPEIAFYIPCLMTGLKHEAKHPNHEEIDARYMAQAKAGGYAVNTWTVNDEARARALRDLGVNSLITDKPDTLIAALKA